MRPAITWRQRNTPRKPMRAARRRTGIPRLRETPRTRASLFGHPSLPRAARDPSAALVMQSPSLAPMSSGLRRSGERVLARLRRQLLPIARAFLDDPEIVILDEATSSVDTRTEVLVQK